MGPCFGFPFEMHWPVGTLGGAVAKTCACMHFGGAGCFIFAADSSMCCSAFGVPGIGSNGVLLKRTFLLAVNFRGASRRSLLAFDHSSEDLPDFKLDFKLRSLHDEHDESVSDDPASVVSSSFGFSCVFLRWRPVSWTIICALSKPCSRDKPGGGNDTIAILAETREKKT